MHGFPDREQLMSLVSQEIVGVCISRHQVVINFSSNDYINIASVERFFRDNSAALRSQSDTLTVMGDVVSGIIVDIQKDGEKAIRLILDNEVELTLRDDSEDYETVFFSINGNAMPV
jgi:hypothetical protein